MEKDLDWVYKGKKIFFTTKHQKGVALAPIFLDITGAKIEEYPFDTDQFGTFSLEIPRQSSPLITAEKKCMQAQIIPGSELFLASEGSFGPHPAMPFIVAGIETLFFFDKVRDLKISMSNIFTTTNFAREELFELDALWAFTKKVHFPSHALILRSANPSNSIIFKGIQNSDELEYKFSSILSCCGSVIVETDMRAHLNPTRMQTIQELGRKLAYHLNSLCPNCQTPGFGIKSLQKGLPCLECRLPTDLILKERIACRKCTYQQETLYPKGQLFAEPTFCFYCNP